MANEPTFDYIATPDRGISPPAIEKWAALASFLLAATFIIPSLIYLTGNMNSPTGLLGYHLADFLFGPVWGAGLVIVVYLLRERLGERAPHRMSLALPAAVLAAGFMVAVACVRAANRHYHVIHPELNLESSIPVLVVWTTIVAGLTAAGWHFLGWSMLLLGSSGWTTALLPRPLNVLYLALGAAALFVYLQPELEGLARLLGLAVFIWQGILLWKTGPAEPRSLAPDL